MPFMTQALLRSAPSRIHGRRRRAQGMGAACAALLGATLGLACASMAGAQSLPAPLQMPTPDTGNAAAASAPALQPGEQAPSLPTLGEGVLVSVNDDIISSYDLKQRMLLLMATSGVQVTQENYAQFQQQAMRSLVDEHLQFQEMKQWKVKVEDKEVDDELQRMAKESNMSKDQLLGELKKIGVEPTTLREQIRAQLGWNELVGGRYHSNAQVGRDQVDETMDKIIADGQKPQFEVSEIFLDPTTAGGIENARKGAQQLSQQLNQKVAPFQAVARQFSNAPSAANGGDEGWMVAGNMDPQIEATLQSMKVGDISAPVETKDGVYIFYLRDKSAGNADEVVRITQASVPLPAGASAQQIAAAQMQLANFKSHAPTCAAINELGKNTNGVTVEDLGESQLSDLLPDFATALRPLKDNQTTAPMQNANAMKVLYVCDKRLAGDNAITRDEVESRLVDNRLAMLGKRYLRDLHASATIEDRH